MAGPGPDDIHRTEPSPAGQTPSPGVPQAPTVRSTVQLSAVATDGRSQFDVECEVKFLATPGLVKTAGSNSQAVITGPPAVIRAQLEAALRHLDAGVSSIRMPAESRRTA